MLWVQEIKDTVDGQRILEKKGSAALKDLKRQLQLERKRADKLQERLQEILTNSKTRTGTQAHLRRHHEITAVAAAGLSPASLQCQ
ncbi:hypothetical protein INR49_024624 [Caranx melampygus]|nr:hypothetical protein INR49_024624 [Caranx melampygus]